jgi:glycosyltransferase involved in cell wall biosynthesis
MIGPGELVSVVLPTHGRAHLLPRAAGSVLAQTYTDLELLIVDDASTDDTAKAVERLADPRVRYHRLERRSGAPAARNVGLKMAVGRFVAFQDSDDEWHAEKLAFQVPRLATLPERTALTYTAMTRITPHGTVRIPRVDEVRALSGDLRASLVHGNFISTQTILARTDTLRAIGGFDEGMPRLQDWDLWLTLAGGHVFDFIDKVLVMAYETEDSISRDRSVYLPALERIARKHDALFEQAPEARANLHFSLAVLAARQGRVRAAAGSFLTGLIASPPAVVRRATRVRDRGPARSRSGAPRSRG